MKRPLAAVDDLQSGDVAIKWYHVVSNDADSVCVRRMRDSKVLLLRMLHGFTHQQLDGLVSHMKMWKNFRSVVVNTQESQLLPECLEILSDMVSSRCFIGAGRKFEYVIAQQDEMTPMLELQRLGLTTRIPDIVEDSDKSYWCLTASAASMMEAFIG